MGRPHLHNKRRFSTYRAMDRLEESRPLIVVPAVGDNLAMLSIEGAQKAYQEQEDAFKVMLGIQPGTSGELTEASERFMEEWFEKRFGRKPIPIEELTANG